MSVSETIERFGEFFEIIRRLRGPDGCPWDKKQTPHSLRSAILEEAYETIDAIDREVDTDVSEEIGDMFLVLTLTAYIYEQEERFSVADLFSKLSEKLIRRHPHVFGDKESGDLSSEQVVDQWQKIKVEVEGKRAKESIMDEVASFLPPLERSHKIQKKASKVGFDWPNVEGVLDKIHEEAREVAEILPTVEPSTRGENVPAPDAAHSRLEEEVGDLIFSVVNLSRYLGVDPTMALNRTNEKFVQRFQHVEREMASRNLPLSNEHFKTMDAIWDTLRVPKNDEQKP